jgi:phage shock protein PspC (stress-responsive transcriptional regulator)
MGSVSDFKAAEEQEFAAGAEAKQEKRQSSTGSSERIADKKLYRDQRRKILGGVCAGLAHYFSVDPIWPRLLFALLVLGSYGGLLLVYIIFWIVLPVSDSLEEEPTAKKMFRDSERKVIGGVASGVAAFFGVDMTVIRLLFVIFGLVGGAGIVVYIILWIALPEAKTITEKMEMQGEPVTLSNIESNVKKGLNEKEGEEESALTKIVLFPFRLIAAVINGLAKILGPVFSAIIDIFRIAFGIIIMMTGLSLIFALVLAFGVAIGLFSLPQGSFFNDWYVNAPNLPIDAIRQSFPTWTVFFAFVLGFVPALFMTLIGSSIIAKKLIFNGYVGWTLFVLFFLSAAFLSFKVPQMVYAFKEEGEYKVEQTFAMDGKQPVLRLNEVGYDDYDVTELTLRGYEGTDLKLVQRFGSQGNTRKIAIENAKMVDYHVGKTDSVLTFDSNILFKKDAKFRAQRLDMELYIPYDQPFTIEEEMWTILDNIYEVRDFIYGNQTHVWKMTRQGMECVSCEETKRAYSESARDQYGLRDFNSLDIEGLMDVRLAQGDDFAVELNGPESEKRKYDLYVDGETLVIDYENNKKFFWNNHLSDDEMELIITMPHLRKIDMRGAGKVNFRGFDEEDLEIKLLGAVVADGQLNARNLDISMTGASMLDLNGTGNFMEADITGACGIRAYGFEVNHAIIEAHGASTAKVFVNERLEIDKGIASNVSHRGDCEVINRN